MQKWRELEKKKKKFTWPKLRESCWRSFSDKPRRTWDWEFVRVEQEVAKETAARVRGEGRTTRARGIEQWWRRDIITEE